MKPVSNGEDRQRLADKVNKLAEEVNADNPALATILWGVTGALLLKRERMFSRMMQSWIESRINEVHNKKEKRKKRRKKHGR